MENKSVIKLEQTSLEWAVNFYTRKQMKFEIYVKNNLTEFHVWHESLWSNKIVESIDYYDNNGNCINDAQWYLN